jgi:pimeloyl-ACP methyl ester carboxylesterase
MRLLGLLPKASRDAAGTAWIRRAGALLALIVLPLAVGAQPVTIVHEGRRLSASLELAPGSTLRDGVVVMVHGTMGHRDMDVMRRFRAMLAERGHNALSMTLSLGIDAREGMFDCDQPSTHRSADALPEIGAWIAWTAAQGARRITLLGFSRGGQQAAWFSAARPDPRVDRLVLLAPIIAGDLAGRYDERSQQPLATLLARARAAGPAAAPPPMLRDIAFLNCPTTTASAASFLSYYAPAADSELPATLPRIGVPTLVVLAGNDAIAVDMERRLAPLVDGQRIRATLVTGSDHFFHDLYGEDAADAIDAFLRR